MKYNKSEIMKNAWSIKKSYNARALSFGECLKRAWETAKHQVELEAQKGTKFENGMTIKAHGYERTLNRWTKGIYDRIYINCGRKSDGYVDIKNGVAHLYNSLTYTSQMAEIILSMEF